MLKVEQAVKTLYQSDSTDKNLILDFYRPGQTVPFLSLWDGTRILGESMELDESLSSSENIDFGSCEASQIKITLIDVEENIKGAFMNVYQTLESLCPEDDLYPSSNTYPSGYTMPLGRYIVQTAERRAARKYRDIVALDSMTLFDVSVIDWYNELPFPLTLRDFRASLCRRIGVTEYVPDYLPNDNMLVYKTIDTAELMGRDVLTACEQLNGAFGHFDRMGVLQHVVLQPNYTLMPSDNLYPAVDLYPVLPGEMNEQVYNERITDNLSKSCRFEEYTVRSIDKVQIRQEEGDIGAIYGTGENCLTIEGNFLVFGKTAAELNMIAVGIYGMVANRQYIPYECSLKGLPYLEVGDTELIEAGQGNIVTYIMKRSLKGTYALKDTHSATGEEMRSVEHNINTEIIQLKGKSAVIKRNVEEVSVNLKDLEAHTESLFKQTSDKILAEVKRASEAEASLVVMADKISTSVTNLKTDTNSRFEQTDKKIELKVSIGDISSKLSVESDKITLSGNRLIVDSTNFKLDGDGNATFSGDIRGADIYGSAIFGGTIDIGDGTFLVDVDGSVNITSGEINIGNIHLNDNYAWLYGFGIASSVIYSRGSGEQVLISTSEYDGSGPAIELKKNGKMTRVGYGAIVTDDISLNELEREYDPTWGSISRNIIELWNRIAEIENSM